MHVALPPPQKSVKNFLVDREQVDPIKYNLVHDVANHDSVASRRARRRVSLTTWFDLHVR